MYPLRYSFQPVASCQHVATPPTIDGDLKEWGRQHLLPDWFEEEDQALFATFYAAWDDGHLYFATQVNLRRPPRVNPRRFWEGDCLELFLDLRGTLAHNAFGEHCVHFFFLPQGAGNPRAHGGRCEPGVDNQVAVADDELLDVGGQAVAQGYTLEIAMPRDAIPTFDPIAHGSIGFNYVLHDATHRTQCWSVGKELHTYRDPSTWGVLELVRDDADSKCGS